MKFLPRRLVFFFRQRISRYVQNVVLQRPNLNVWGFDIPQQTLRAYSHQRLRKIYCGYIKIPYI